MSVGVLHLQTSQCHKGSGKALQLWNLGKEETAQGPQKSLQVKDMSPCQGDLDNLDYYLFMKLEKKYLL